MSTFSAQRWSDLQRFFEQFHGNVRAAQPRVIFIGCMDSRVPPELMLNAKPGEMMVIRVPGGLVHAQGLGDASVSSAIEMVLRRVPTVESIIVCGHTNCLLLQELANGIEAIQEPNLARWLSMGDYIRAQASTRADHATDPAGYQQAILEFSVRRSLDDLREIPVVAERERAGKITLEGWYIDLERGKMMVYDATREGFFAQDTGEAATPAAIATHTPAPVSTTAPTKRQVEYGAEALDDFELPDVILTTAVPASVAPAALNIPSVQPTSVEPHTVAPSPVEVPKARPVQRVYASEVLPAEPPATPATTNASSKPAFTVPANVTQAANDPSLNDLKQIMRNLRGTPNERLNARDRINAINTREGWINLARAVREVNDPEVRQAMREVAVELKSPQARAQMRQILASLDENTILEGIANLDPNKVRSDFESLVQNIRNSQGKK